MIMNNVRKQIADLLLEKDNFLLVFHITPDGDALGSTLALQLALKAINKKVSVFCKDPIPSLYTFLPGSGEVISELIGNYDVVVAIDCADMERTGIIDLDFWQNNCSVNIDHHPSNDGYAQLNLIDPNAAATGEIIYDLVQDLGVKINLEIATCLYTSILTDTGGFRFSNTTKETFRLAAQFTELGVNPGEIANLVFQTKPYASLKLLGSALQTLTLLEDGKIAIIEVTQDMFAHLPPGEVETEGIVNYARMIEGVEVGILFKEVESDLIRVGLRSKSYVDVAKIAKSFGGGGHQKAAGCTFASTLAKAKAELLAQVNKALQE